MSIKRVIQDRKCLEDRMKEQLQELQKGYNVKQAMMSTSSSQMNYERKNKSVTISRKKIIKPMNKNEDSSEIMDQIQFLQNDSQSKIKQGVTKRQTEQSDERDSSNGPMGFSNSFQKRSFAPLHLKRIEFIRTQGNTPQFLNRNGSSARDSKQNLSYNQTVMANKREQAMIYDNLTEISSSKAKASSFISTRSSQQILRDRKQKEISDLVEKTKEQLENNEINQMSDFSKKIIQKREMYFQNTNQYHFKFSDEEPLLPLIPKSKSKQIPHESKSSKDNKQSQQESPKTDSQQIVQNVLPCKTTLSNRQSRAASMIAHQKEGSNVIRQTEDCNRSDLAIYPSVSRHSNSLQGNGYLQNSEDNLLKHLNGTNKQESLLQNSNSNLNGIFNMYMEADLQMHADKDVKLTPFTVIEGSQINEGQEKDVVFFSRDLIKKEDISKDQHDQPQQKCLKKKKKNSTRKIINPDDIKEPTLTSDVKYIIKKKKKNHPLKLKLKTNVLTTDHSSYKIIVYKNKMGVYCTQKINLSNN